MENSEFGKIVPSKIVSPLGFVTLYSNPPNSSEEVVSAKRTTVSPGRYDSWSVERSRVSTISDVLVDDWISPSILKLFSREWVP